MFDGELGRLDGIVLLMGLVAVIIWMVRMGLKTKNISDPLQTELIDEVPSELPMKTAIFWIIVGLGILIFSSYILVWGATGIARAFGVRDLVIGLTIIAIGTSLPELAASVMGALKGEHEIALGNVMGPNRV